MPSSKFFFSILLAILSGSTYACDLCGCYNRPIGTTHADISTLKSFSIYAGVAEQFTSFGTDRMNGTEVANPTGEYLNSSITQIFMGAAFFGQRLSLQANVPLIYRSFRRPAGFEIEHGTVSGLGDILLSANYVVFAKEGLFHEGGKRLSTDGKTTIPVRGEPDFSATMKLSAGLKLPTGDTSELGKPELEVEGAPASGIGGHDLTLGTGSVDGIFGAQVFLRYKEVFFQTDAQFSWRGLGAYSYRYANDFSWSGGPGFYVVRKSARSLALQFVISGETKGYDYQYGEAQTDSGVTSLYLGPRILCSWARLTGEIGVDLPVIMNTTSFQTTPDYRIRAGLTYQF